METRWGLFRTNTFQTSNITAGNHVEFDGVSGNLAVSTGAGQLAGLITLTTGRAYLLTGEIKYTTTSANPNEYVSFQWYDVYGDPIGTAGRYRPNDISSSTKAEALVDIREDTSQTVQLKIVRWYSSGQSVMGFAEAKDVTETITLPSTDGGAGAGGGGTGSTLIVGTFYHTLTASDITNKSFALDIPAYVPSEIMLDVITGGPQFYGVDFIADTNNIMWGGYVLEGFLEEGEVIRLHYMYDSTAVPFAPMALVGISEEEVSYQNVTMAAFKKVITESDLQAKAIILPVPAAHPEDLTVTITDGIHLVFGVNYTADLTKISWEGYNLGEHISIGSVLEFRYIAST